MTDKTSLGDRIKKYEKAYNQKFPIRLPLILRLDGVHFHTNVKRWKCEKPFDENLIEAMLFTAKTLCESISGAQLAYVQSDEITMLIRDDMTLHSQPWYDKEINKIMSVAAAKASNAFNYKYFELVGHEYEENFGDIVTMTDPIKSLSYLAEFDCRGFVVPEQEILNCFLWRQRDCEKNSIQMLARSPSLFSHEQLDGKNGNEMQDMMMLEKGVNWNDIPTHQKRGACIIKREVPKTVPKRNEKGKVIEGEFEEIMRNAWVIDREIPIFSKETDYVNQFARICKEE